MPRIANLLRMGRPFERQLISRVVLSNIHGCVPIAVNAVKKRTRTKRYVPESKGQFNI
jgi:hypothetical protein